MEVFSKIFGSNIHSLLNETNKLTRTEPESFHRLHFVYFYRNLRKLLPVIGILIVGLGISLFLFQLLLRFENDKIQARFLAEAKNKSFSISREIAENLEVLSTIRSFFESSDNVTRHDFYSFTSGALQRHGNIQALEWIPRIRGSERQYNEAMAQKDGLKEFVIKEKGAAGDLIPAKSRDEYFPVFYAEPLAKNRAALGFDLASNQRRLNALNEARDSGLQTVTAKITLVQETGKQCGFLIFDPVFKKNAPINTIEERRTNLVGFALSVVRVNDMIERAIGDKQINLQLHLSDITASSEVETLYQNFDAVNSSYLNYSKQFDVGGRQWKLSIQPQHGFYVLNNYTMAYTVLFLCIFLTLAFSAYVYLLLNTHEKIKLRDERLEKQAHDLQEALEAEKQLCELQRKFVSMASHEFRTPLAIIDSSAYRLESKVRDNQASDELILERIERIRQAVVRMTRLVESTLNGAQLEAGKMSIDLRDCDLTEILRTVCKEQQELTNKHLISLNLGTLPSLIQADPNALIQIFTNLLSNAVKYSPRSKKIYVKAYQDESQIIISVKDNGLGIGKDDASQIFNRFFRAETSAGITGTGIGLHLTKNLIEKHNGTITFESRVGMGTTFTVSLPIQINPKLPASHEQNIISACA